MAWIARLVVPGLQSGTGGAGRKLPGLPRHLTERGVCSIGVFADDEDRKP